MKGYTSLKKEIMTLPELSESIQFLNDNNIPKELSMYVVKGDLTIRHANLEESARNDLKNRFLTYLYRRVENPELNYSNLSEFEDRTNAICYYDLHDLPLGLKVMQSVLDKEDMEEFSAENDGFDDIVGFVFLIGNEEQRIAIYKKHFHISVIKQSDKFLSFGRSDTGLKQITEDIIKISENFEFLQINQHVIVFSTKTLENSFGYHGILQAAAKQKFDLISEAELIENIEELEELIVEKKYAKRMIGIKASTPVLALPFDRIRNFILNHPKLRRRLKFNDANDKIRFHSKKSKELFLDLVTDSFLKSELTELLYHSTLKDELSTDEEAE